MVYSQNIVCVFILQRTVATLMVRSDIVVFVLPLSTSLSFSTKNMLKMSDGKIRQLYPEIVKFNVRVLIGSCSLLEK